VSDSKAMELITEVCSTFEFMTQQVLPVELLYNVWDQASGGEGSSHPPTCAENVASDSPKKRKNKKKR